MTATFALLTFVANLVDFCKARHVYTRFASTFLVWVKRISDDFHYFLIVVTYLNKIVFLFVRFAIELPQFDAI